MPYDPRAFDELIEESQDLQADALRGLQDPIDALVERREQCDAAGGPDPDEAAVFADGHVSSIRHSLRAAPVLAAAGAGALLVGLAASPAFASSTADVQILQTAASIEKLAVDTYTTAETLPYIGGSAANPVVRTFVSVTKSQHAQHLLAFNAAIGRLGGKQQQSPDPAFVPVVNKAVASLAHVSDAAGALAVVGLALELENVAAETYVNDVPMLGDSEAKQLTASIMGVEAQHVAVLLAVQALLKAGAPQLISLAPGTAAKLPAVAGKVGFPNAFYMTTNAAPATQGAVK